MNKQLLLNLIKKYRSNQILRDAKNLDNFSAQHKELPEEYYKFYKDNNLSDQDYQDSLLFSSNIQGNKTKLSDPSFITSAKDKDFFSIYDDNALNKLQLYELYQKNGLLPSIDPSLLRKDFNILFDDASIGAEQYIPKIDDYGLKPYDRKILDNLLRKADNGGVEGTMSAIESLYAKYPISSNLWEPERLKKIGYE